MNQTPQWGPQGQWSGQQQQQQGWGPQGQAPFPPPRRSGPPTIVIILAVLFGLPALAVVGCMVCVKAHVDTTSTGDPSSEDGKACVKAKRIVVDRLPADATRSLIEERHRLAVEGIAACDRAGMTKEKEWLVTFEQALAQRLAQPDPAPTAPPMPLDPSSCPQGRVLIDPATGKAVRCTGAANAGTTATSDDDDVRALCKSVKAAWDRSDGIDPIIRCSGEGPNHQDIVVEVTGPAWDFLGDHGKRRAFAKSLVDAYTPHWRSFHGWKGAEPAEKQVHIMKMKGLDLELAALASASGFYRE